MKAGVLICAVAIAGCAATGVKVTDAQLSAFKPGEATESQVIAALGSPTMRMRLADGTVMLMYSYVEVQTRPASFIPVAGAFAGGSDMRSSTASLRFDQNGKLIDTTSTASAYGTGVGAAAGSVDRTQTQQPRQ